MSSTEQPGRLEACVRAFEAHFIDVQRTLRRMGVLAADVEDLAQEVFIVMWRRWPEFDQRRPVRPWLTGIAFKVVGGHLRRSRREVPLPDLDALDVFDEAPHGEEGLAASRARRIVIGALDRLPETYRTVLVLRDIEGVPMRKIAALQGVPLFTAYTRLRTARRVFAEAVKRGHSQPDRRPAVLLAPVPLFRALWRGMVASALAGGLLWLCLSSPDVLGEDHAPTSPTERVRVRTPAPARSLALVVPGAARLPPPRLVAAPVAPAPDVGLAGLSRGLLGYWSFDDSPGATVRDHSAARGDCTLKAVDPGRAWTDGRRGAALQLDSRGWLECPQPRISDVSADELTVAAWVKVRSLPVTGIRGVVTRPSGSGSRDHFFLGFSGDRVMFNSHSWGAMIVHRQSMAGDGRWHHLAFSRGKDTVTLYADGRPVRRLALRDQRRDAVETPVLIGAGSNRPGHVHELIDGMIDEVVMYGRALDDAEIGRLAEARAPSI